MDYTDVNDQLRNIAQIARKCPTVTLRRAYVQAFRDWANQTRWIKKTISMDTSVQSGLEAAHLIPLTGEDASFLEVAWIDGNIIGIDTDLRNTEFKIRPGDREQWILNADPNRPQWYAYKPEGMFDLWPTPDKTYQLRVCVALQPQDGVLRVPLDPLKKFSTQIEAGALEYLLSIPGQPWTDKNESMAQGKVFRAGINNAKADAQRGFNTGSQRVAPRRFIRY